MHFNWWKNLQRRLSNIQRSKAQRSQPRVERLEAREVPAALVRTGTGATAVELTAVVDAYRQDLGDPINPPNSPDVFTSGRREINWDGVPDGSAAPNNLPPDFFNNNSKRGVVFSTPGTAVRVSANEPNVAGTPTNFGDIEPTYQANFLRFSGDQLFTPIGSNVTEVRFFVPSQPTVAATVSGFGVVFSDVDEATSSKVEFFDANGQLLTALRAPVRDGGLSFVGATFTGNERVGMVRITSGDVAAAAGVVDEQNGNDVVVLDDFIYGEPIAATRVSFSAPSVTVQEDKTSVILTLNRTGNTSGASTVNFDLHDVTAASGQDYRFRTGTVTFNALETTKTIEIPLIDDNLPEGIESFLVELSSPSGGTILDNGGRTTVNILDNEIGSPILFAIDTAGNLLRLRSDAPGTILSTTAITGLQQGEQLIGIDFRPATGQLYGAGSTGRLYRLNTSTGAATQVGTTTFNPALNGTEFGFDFNPVPDRIRVVSDQDQNLRLNPDTGAVAATDPVLAYADNDFSAGQNPRVVAIAYTNSLSGVVSTTLYGIDSALDRLVVQGSPGGAPTSPNGGQLSSIGLLGVDTTDLVGLDIGPGSGEGLALASLTRPGATTSDLFTINLTNGRVGLVGTIGGGVTIRDIAIAPSGVLQFSNVVFNVAENGTNAAITLQRLNGSEGAVSVTLTASNGTATAGTDFTATTTTVSWADGDTAPKTVQIPITEDAVFEGPETVQLRLTAPQGGASLGLQQVANLIIADNDAAPIASITSRVTVTEGNTGTTTTATFTVTLSSAAGTTINVAFASAPGTATAPADYTATNGTLTFAPGETTKTISVNVVGDTILEGRETATVALTAPDTNVVIAPNGGVGTLLIRDDDGTPVQRFLATTFLELLGRPIDDGGLQFFTTFVAANGRQAAVKAIEGSVEYRTLIVRNLFQQLLKRDPDANGLSFFVAAIGNGATVEQVTSIIVTSPEYFQKRGNNSNETFLNAVYRDLLQRDADTNGTAFFLQVLAQPGANRSAVVDQFFASQEYREKVVQREYRRFLDRDADANGLAFFAAALKAGARQEDVIAALLGSDEFFNNQN